MRVCIVLPVLTDDGMKIHPVLDPQHFSELNDAVVGLSNIPLVDSIDMLQGIVPALDAVIDEGVDEGDENK